MWVRGIEEEWENEKIATLLPSQHPLSACLVPAYDKRCSAPQPAESNSMKGPFERLKYDLRRIWECPSCGHKVRTDGAATTQFCRCGKPNTNPEVPMKLIGDGARRLVPRVPPPKIEAEPTVQVDVIAVDAVTAATATIEVTTVETVLPPKPPTETGPEA